MDTIPSVVQGEASESDSDQENTSYKPREIKGSVSSPHGAVIVGEAPESDEEEQTSATTVSHPIVSAQPTPPTWNSLLHKKLGESNMSLHSNLLSLVRTNVQLSLTQLTSSEQILLKSQLKLQRASTVLRGLDSMNVLLSERLALASCSAFLPTINIPQDQPHPHPT